MLQWIRDRVSWWWWWLSGLWPRYGELHAHVVEDEGEEPVIHLCFSHPMRRIVLDASGAIEMANELLLAARELEDTVEVGGDDDHDEALAQAPASATRH